MTTTILDAHELERLFAQFRADFPREKPLKGVSGKELADRIKALFTPEEASDLARRIEEGRANRHD